MEGNRRIGTVKWFSRVKGYGFLAPDDEEAEIFVHFTGIEGEGYRNLEKGQKVSFVVEDTEKGPQAVAVRDQGFEATSWTAEPTDEPMGMTSDETSDDESSEAISRTAEPTDEPVDMMSDETGDEESSEETSWTAEPIDEPMDMTSDETGDEESSDGDEESSDGDDESSDGEDESSDGEDESLEEAPEEDSDEDPPDLVA